MSLSGGILNGFLFAVSNSENKINISKLFLLHHGHFYFFMHPLFKS